MDFVLWPRPGSFEPNADVFVDEERGQVVVKVEIAGADPDSLHVEVHELALVIRGLRRDPTRLQRGSFALKEIAYGPFSKTVYLPVAIQFESAAAEFVDGVLAIELPVSSTQYIPTARTEIRMVVKRTLA